VSSSFVGLMVRWYPRFSGMLQANVLYFTRFTCMLRLVSVRRGAERERCCERFWFSPFVLRQFFRLRFAGAITGLISISGVSVETCWFSETLREITLSVYFMLLCWQVWLVPEVFLILLELTLVDTCSFSKPYGFRLINVISVPLIIIAS